MTPNNPSPPRDVRCVFCGRWRSSADTAGSTHCNAPFKVQLHKWATSFVDDPPYPSPPSAAATDEEALYDAFWKRQPEGPRTSWADQADAIKAMWQDIAQDARTRLADRSSQRPSPSVGREEVADALVDLSRLIQKSPRCTTPEGPSYKVVVNATMVGKLEAAADAILARLAQPTTGAVGGECLKRIIDRAARNPVPERMTKSYRSCFDAGYGLGCQHAAEDAQIALAQPATVAVEGEK